MQLVSTVTVGSGGASSIEFTSIPQDGTDLVLLASARESTDGAAFFLRLNGTTTNYTSRTLRGSGSAVSSVSATNNTIEAGANPPDYTSNTFANASVYISNYASSTGKSISADAVTENNATASAQRIQAMFWNDTTAISSITLAAPTSFVQHSTFFLYKITKGSDGTTVVS